MTSEKIHLNNSIILKPEIPAGIGVYTIHKKLYCLFTSPNENGLSLAESNDGQNFEFSKSDFSLPHFRRIHFCTLDIGHLSVAELEGGGLERSLSNNFKNWKKLCELNCELNKAQFHSGSIVSEFQVDGYYLMFLGGESIQVAKSTNAITWEISSYPEPLIKAKNNEYLEIDFVEKNHRGILVCYRSISSPESTLQKNSDPLTNNKLSQHEVHLALFNCLIPDRLIWHSPYPIANHPQPKNSVSGTVNFRSQLFEFWNHSDKGVELIRYPTKKLLFDIPFELPRDQTLSLTKAFSNPILCPRESYEWESFATYNPSAFEAHGKVHILYRAQGYDLMSSIGYANSSDGIQIENRLDKPVYKPQEVFESFQKLTPNEVTEKYMSGGGIAGCEDPRVSVIDNRVYMTYVAFDGASPPRVALTSIHLDDFLAQRWVWKKPVLISPPGIVDKSAVIFPEKINGKYIIMHRIFPNIQIDYVSDLNFDGSYWLKERDHIPIREGMWDSRKIGAGAPPIKTTDGWLLIYYGVDDLDDRFYKMGAMLLDLENPAKVLYRSSTPILEPEEWYENSGFKPGVVYPCGAVLLEKKLLVYYGGADCVVCVASADLHEFILALKSNQSLQLQGFQTQRIQNHATYAT